MRLNGDLQVPDDAMAEFCRRWKIRELALFGSVLREDFGPESDVDVLATFEEGVPWDLFDIVTMKEELGRIFGRQVDLLEREAVEQSRNPFRRRSILNSARVVYSVG